MTVMKKDLAASIHQRLLNLARRENRPLNELLQYFAIERFLFRLGQTKYQKSFILKGAQMLRVWDAPAARPTMDIDLLGKVDDDIENLKKVFAECCAIEVNDGVIFDPKSIAAEIMRKAGDYQGIRVTARGLLGTIRLQLQIDVGFGDVIVPKPVEIELPQLLDFGQPVLLGYTPENAIAEKFHAMVVLDIANTRMKDFYDVWLLATTADLKKTILAEAIRQTFERRRTEIPDNIPIALTSAFTEDETKNKQWQAFQRKNRLNTDLTLRNAAEAISALLLP